MRNKNEKFEIYWLYSLSIGYASSIVCHHSHHDQKYQWSYKYIDTKYKFICDWNKSGHIATFYTPTDWQLADGFIKALSSIKLLYLFLL